MYVQTFAYHQLLPLPRPGLTVVVSCKSARLHRAVSMVTRRTLDHMAFCHISFEQTRNHQATILSNSEEIKNFSKKEIYVNFDTLRSINNIQFTGERNLDTTNNIHKARYYLIVRDATVRCNK